MIARKHCALIVVVLSLLSACVHRTERVDLQGDAISGPVMDILAQESDRLLITIGQRPASHYSLLDPELQGGWLCGAAEPTAEPVCLSRGEISSVKGRVRRGVDTSKSLAAWTVLAPLAAPVAVLVHAGDALTEDSLETDMLEQIEADIARGVAERAPPAG